jgi:hypothetical protein
MSTTEEEKEEVEGILASLELKNEYYFKCTLFYVSFISDDRNQNEVKSIISNQKSSLIDFKKKLILVAFPLLVNPMLSGNNLNSFHSSFISV